MSALSTLPFQATGENLLTLLAGTVAVHLVVSIR
jgi:hypothetical protein